MLTQQQRKKRERNRENKEGRKYRKEESKGGREERIFIQGKTNAPAWGLHNWRLRGVWKIGKLTVFKLSMGSSRWQDFPCELDLVNDVTMFSSLGSNFPDIA